jgi:hypothetical protein
VLFPSNGESRAQPIGEKLRLICTYGDPSSKSPPIEQDGAQVENWFWIDHGFQIKFSNEREVARSYFPATGQGTIIGK